MLFNGTSTADLLAAVGSVSSPIFDNVFPYLIVAVAIPLTFYIVKKIIGLIPKGR
jgi:xanthine/uracil/vitamin C permease (AzgA family)